eukprot:CAMPEP_0178967088 /NCGR_PEP_ID=MMETSP0789-20121207/17348_1 /TAXON_ID=3005 /ORGANISM="Rhizosolenia setigera, Strain CCMP 1694" /LENGTH=252 /DNA_ID=CAMNT_0020652555 /DNA_START=32 /DNA_END=790 /DNA_ORIENTATION=+
MKLAISAALIGSAAAFAPASVSKSSTTALNGVPFNKPSAALPYKGDKGAPATLDGSLPGDVGFDPVGFSTAGFAQWFDGKSEDTMSDLYWLREAEITHGRIAQLAVLGFIVPSWIGTFPGNEWTGLDAYSYTNPTEALDHVPGLAVFQIISTMIWIELKRVQLIGEQGSSRMPGDLGLGQTGFNPFGLDYSPEEYYEKQVQEIKHCRLAMLGAAGLWLQAVNSGKDIATQLGDALVAPEYYAKAGYFLPEGI